MRDEKGFDFKVLCVALGDAHQQHIERLEQVRPHRLVEIEHFFQTYKALEDKTVDVVGWRDNERALEVLRDRPRCLGARDRRTARVTGSRAAPRWPGRRPAGPPALRRRPDPGRRRRRGSRRSSIGSGRTGCPAVAATSAGSGSTGST